MKEELAIISNGNDDDPELCFEGIIDSDTEIHHPIFIPTPPPDMTLNLKGCKDITDSGVSIWMNWIHKTAQISKITLKALPFCFVEKHNSNSNFIPSGIRIISFEMKYICIECGHIDKFLMKNGADYTLKSKIKTFENRECSKCCQISKPAINKARELSFLLGSEQNRYVNFNSIKTAGVVVFDERKRIVFANENFSTLMNISNKRLLNNHLIVYDILSTDNKELFCARDGILGKSEPFGPVPIKIKNKNENITNLSISIFKDEYTENRWIATLENNFLQLIVTEKRNLTNQDYNDEVPERVNRILKNSREINTVKEIDKGSGAVTLNTFLRDTKALLVKAKSNKHAFNIISVQIDSFDDVIDKLGDDVAISTLKKVFQDLHNINFQPSTIARSGKCKFTLLFSNLETASLQSNIDLISSSLTQQINEQDKDNNPLNFKLNVSIGGLHVPAHYLESIQINTKTIKRILTQTNNNLDKAIQQKEGNSIYTDISDSLDHILETTK